MPIIKPEIQKVLRSAGLLPEEQDSTLTIDENLNLAGLSTEAIAEELSNLALRSGNEALRLRALETALKVKGALKDQPVPIPSFTIVIQNSGSDLSKTGGVNPIVFPRASLNQGVKEEKPN